MSINATEAAGPSIFGPAAATAATTASQTDKDMFLQLMVTQMRYQDPLNPSDSAEFLAQSAQFTALEKMQEVADQTSLLLAAQMAFGATGLVGRQVSWADAEGVTQQGTVSGVTFGASGPVLDVGGTEVPLASIVTVTDGTGSGTGTGTGTESGDPGTGDSPTP